MKTELKYGLIFSLVVVVYVMIEHALGFNTTRHNIGQYTRLGGVLVPIVALFLGIKEKRNKELNGRLTFGQGVKTGVLIAVIQTTLTTLFFFVYGNIINPDFLPTLLEFERTKMSSGGYPEAEISAQLERLKAMYSLPVQPIFQMMIGISYGFVLSLLFSALLKRKST
ncbi:MAG: DUF4199 domain-containing protein [Pyrinomonadaceae bacterium]